MIEINNYYPEPYGDFQLGFASVKVKNKLDLIVKVCKAKSGAIFCTFTAVKLGGVWEPTFKLANKEAEKKLLEQINEKVKPMVKAAPAASVPPRGNEPPPQEPEDDFPF